MSDTGNAPKRKHVSIVQAAEMLELERSTVIKLVRKGDLDAFKKTLGITSPYRVYLDSIRDFINKRQERK